MSSSRCASEDISMVVCFALVKEIDFRPACQKSQMLFADCLMQKMHTSNIPVDSHCQALSDPQN
jgi:hypothetical protein